jgi:hypothetical protein
MNAMKATFRAMSDFQDADVVIGDYGILDGPLDNAPYILIEKGGFTSSQQTQTPNTDWEIPTLLIVRFVDWPTSIVDLMTREQAIIDRFNVVGSNRSPGAVSAVTINAHTIRSDGEFLPLYDKFADTTVSLPDYLTQRIIFEVNEN